MEIDCFNEKSSSVEKAPVMERNENILFAEEFQVDDLLDLKGLPEPEKDDAEDDDTSKGLVLVALEKEEAFHLSEISLPEETEAANLEWLSRFVDDCHSEYPPTFASMAGNHKAYFPMKQPSLWSTAAAACNLKKEAVIPVKAKRSKRPRRVGAFWSLSCTSPASSITTAVVSTISPSCSSSSSSYILYESYPSPANIYTPKKRGRKPKISMASGATVERRCMHCGVQKTPQWRAGPHGPKTLCNACGVRFKSGRLLPEYRPACSPTFLSHIHSNNHRKVLEMRRKKEVQLLPAAAPPVHSC